MAARKKRSKKKVPSPKRYHLERAMGWVDHGLAHPGEAEHAMREAHDHLVYAKRSKRNPRRLSVRSNPMLAVVGNPPRRPRRVRHNPMLAIVGNPHEEGMTPGAMRRRITELKLELDDAEYFNHSPMRIAGLRDEIAELEDALEAADARFERASRSGLSRSRVEEERRRERERYMRDRRRNPRPEVHPLAYEARRRYREDLMAGHGDAAEYWRGQAGAFFTDAVHPDYMREIYELEQRELERRNRNATGKRSKKKSGRKGGKKSKKQVAGPGGRDSLKKEGRKVRKNRTAGKSKKAKPKLKRYTLEEARKKFEGFDEALKAYKRFHKADPSHVDVYEIDDGKPGKTVDRVHAALHRTVETNYLVPDGWESNKNGSLWKHEHVEGFSLDNPVGEPDPEDFPLEVLDPATGTTRKFGGRFRVTTWWYD